jgi:hypothetical protein
MSDEAKYWVLEQSKLKGFRLCVLFFIADKLNERGEGTFGGIPYIARLLRISRQRSQQLYHDIEASEELVCMKRGTGRSYTIWQIPGVVRDGYDEKFRGKTVLPLRQPSLAPGARMPSARGKAVLPNTSTGTSTSKLDHKTYIPPPPTTGGGGQIATEIASDTHYNDFLEWLAENCPSMDKSGQERLVRSCRKAKLGCTLSDILRVCIYKLATADGARNPAGLLIATVPAILAAEGHIGGQ